MPPMDLLLNWEPALDGWEAEDVSPFAMRERVKSVMDEAASSCEASTPLIFLFLPLASET